MSRTAIVRDSIVRIVKMLTEKKVQVTQRGTQAYVTYNKDGSPAVVNIPYIPDEATEELLLATQGFLDHEVAHVLFSDYNALKLGIERGVGSLNNIIEDSFIERKMAAQFPGSGFNLRAVGEYFLKEYTDKKLRESPEMTEAVLIVPAIRAWAGQSVFIDYMADKWEKIDDIVKRLGSAVEDLPKITNSMESLACAEKFKKLLEHEEEAPPELRTTTARTKGPKPKSERKAGEKPKKGSGGGDMVGDADDMPGGEVEAPGTDGDEDEAVDKFATPGKVEEGDEPASEDEVVAAGEGADEEDEDEGGPGSSDDEEDDDEYDEAEEGSASGGGGGIGEGGTGDFSRASSDDLYAGMEKGLKDFDEEVSKLISDKAVKETAGSAYRVYSRDFDIIETMPVPDSRWDDSYLSKMQSDVDHMVGPLQKDFERAIAAKSASTWSSGHRSGRIHASSLSRLAFNDDRIFRRKHINNGKDVAVSLLIDCSGSMSGHGKIRAAAYTAYGLSSVLDRMNIGNEVLGFTTKKQMGREAYASEEKMGAKYARNLGLYMPILKGYQERLNSEVKKRFAMLPEVGWLSENVDGECVEIAAQRLAGRKEKRKILIVLSDGSPACPGDYRAQDQHLKRTVKRVEQAGVEVLGIGILDDAAKQFYTKHVLLSSLADLPTTVIGQIKKILMQ